MSEKNCKRVRGIHSKAYNTQRRAIRKLTHALGYLDEFVYSNSARVRGKEWQDAVTILWNCRNAVSLDFEVALNRGETQVWASRELPGSVE